MEQTQASFEALAAAATDLLNRIATEDPSFLRNATATQVEEAAFKALQAVCDGSPFSMEDVRWISGARFPDIVVGGRFGVEVKSTAKDYWTSTGSSIVETTREPGVGHILLLFAKLGGTRAEFRCRPYGEVMREIAVTHCPRYLIDMELADGESIFDKIGTDYDTFRSGGQAISIVRDYYRRKALAEGRAEMPWWLGDTHGDTATSVTVGFWKDLPAETRKDYQARMFALFPEVLKSDFDNASLWLVTTKSVLNAHIRDTFSAGGTVSAINGERLPKPAPQIYKRLIDSAPRIRALLADSDFLSTEAATFNPALLAAGPSSDSSTQTPSSPFDAWLSQITALTADQRLRPWLLAATASSPTTEQKQIPFL